MHVKEKLSLCAMLDSCNEKQNLHQFEKMKKNRDDNLTGKVQVFSVICGSSVRIHLTPPLLKLPRELKGSRLYHSVEDSPGLL